MDAENNGLDDGALATNEGITKAFPAPTKSRAATKEIQAVEDNMGMQETGSHDNKGSNARKEKQTKEGVNIANSAAQTTRHHTSEVLRTVCTVST